MTWTLIKDTYSKGKCIDGNTVTYSDGLLIVRDFCLQYREDTGKKMISSEDLLDFICGEEVIVRSLSAMDVEYHYKLV